MIGFDTESIIQYYRNNAELLKLIETLDDDFCSTILNYQEIMFGIDPKNEKYNKERDFFNAFFESVIQLGFNKDTCDKSNDIFWQLRKSGNSLDKFDCMIAGIFLANGVNKIITRNIKHFEKIPGLKIISY